MNFWNQDHPLSADYNRLYEALVPPSGHCNTLQGELLRAASRINYDWFNNGWGCNNWSGAVLFLQKNLGFLSQGRDEKDCADFIDALRTAHYFSHGERVSISDERADAVVTVIAAFVVQAVINNPKLIDNEFDMFELSEPNAPYEDEEEYWEDEDDEY